MNKPDLNRFAALSLVTLAFGLPACVGAAPGATVAEDDAQPAVLAAPSNSTPTSTPMSCNSNGATYHCKGHIRTDVRAQLQPAAVQSGLSPADLASAYALDTTLKPGATVAIIDAFGYANVDSDLTAYRAKYNLPACTVANGCLTVVNQQGNKSPLPAAAPANDDWTVETALDLDMASAACPSCKLLLVQADDDAGDGLMTAQATAVALGATVISNSWGGPESRNSPGSTQEKFFTLAKPVAIFVAAGDDGYDDGGSGPDYPSVSAHVIAVGGTTLSRSVGGRGWSETAWSSSSNGNGAGGSSCSVSIPKPSYQATLATQCSFRASADLAAVGDPATGVAVYNRAAGGFIVVGGTSAASPFVAGVFALYGKGGAAPAFPYSNTDAFYDVTSGSNGTCGNILCNAGKGWDGPTGVGTPNGTMFGGGSTSTSDMGTTPDLASGPDMTPSLPATGGVVAPIGGSTGTGSSSGSGSQTSGGSSAASSRDGGGCSMSGAATAGGSWLWSAGLLFAAALRRRRNR